MPKFKGPGGAIHDIDPALFGKARLKDQIRRGDLTPVDGESFDPTADELPEAIVELIEMLDGQTMDDLAEFVAENELPEALAGVTPKSDRVRQIADAVLEALDEED